jgi:hypothetical protein
MVADDPSPVEAGSQRLKQRPRRVRQPVAPEPVVETVAEAVKAGGAGPLDLPGQCRQGRVRIIGRQELPALRVPAGLFEMQVGDQQCFLRLPEQGAAGRGNERFSGERKGNHGPALAQLYSSASI